jgi:hypothetical protein
VSDPPVLGPACPWGVGGGVGVWPRGRRVPLVDRRVQESGGAAGAGLQVAWNGFCQRMAQGQWSVGAGRCRGRGVLVGRGR